jgi:hypothetical protein
MIWGNGMLANPKPQVVETGRSPLLLPEAVGEDCFGVQLESRNRLAQGKSGDQHVVAWRQGSCVGIFMRSGRSGSFDVGDTVALARMQVEHIVMASRRMEKPSTR